MTNISIKSETYPLAQRFTISRGSRTHAHVVKVTLSQNGYTGHGECVPYARYGESVQSVSALIESVRADLANGLTRLELQTRLPAGAARNAIDCAFWDLEAKRAGKRIWELLGVSALVPVTTAYTLSLESPEAMGHAAQNAAHRPILKIKLGASNEDRERLMAVRAHAPDSTLIVDANEGWNENVWQECLRACEEAKVALIEQPFPAEADEALATLKRRIPICADESIHDGEHLDHMIDRYDVINIKLDKTGGLTQALILAKMAQAHGLGIMVGCMVGTSLSMAPALCLAPYASFVDLDGPLLLAQDCAHGLHYEGSLVYPPSVDLWG
jgi:L-Ala-D/L-Glu epimerase